MAIGGDSTRMTSPIDVVVEWWCSVRKVAGLTPPLAATYRDLVMGKSFTRRPKCLYAVMWRPALELGPRGRPSTTSGSRGEGVREGVTVCDRGRGGKGH